VQILCHGAVSIRRVATRVRNACCVNAGALRAVLAAVCARRARGEGPKTQGGDEQGR